MFQIIIKYSIGYRYSVYDVIIADSKDNKILTENLTERKNGY